MLKSTSQCAFDGTKTPKQSERHGAQTAHALHLPSITFKKERSRLLWSSHQRSFVIIYLIPSICSFLIYDILVKPDKQDHVHNLLVCFAWSCLCRRFLLSKHIFCSFHFPFLSSDWNTQLQKGTCSNKRYDISIIDQMCSQQIGTMCHFICINVNMHTTLSQGAFKEDFFSNKQLSNSTC